MSAVDEVNAFVDEVWDLDMTVADWWERLVNAGLCQPAWPVAAGGGGRTNGEARTILGALAKRGVVGPPLGHVAATLAAPTLLQHGTPEQIASLVRDIARGRTSWCQLFSEPGSGSDLASVGARAERDGDEWVITGQKVWNSAADQADLGMLLVRTDPDQPKHRGMSYFVVDMDQPGVEARPLTMMNGTSGFCEVFLTEARVRADAMVGDLNDGWRVAQTTLLHERNMTAGGGIAGFHPARSGVAHGDLERTVGEIVERSKRSAARRRSPIRAGAVPATVMIDLAREHGKTVEAVTRQDLASYYTQVKVNGWTMRRIAAAGGRLTGADGSIAKLTTSRICQVSRDLSYRIVGAPLMLSGPDSPMGGDLQSVNLASPGTRIGGGTDEIQLSLLGERGLGLPREPGDDRDVPYRDLCVGTQR
jgi:alkylation response protein AidB-like acyl-CoA dehydrogenase